MDEEGIGRAILDSAMKVHSALGSGLLESAYETCLAHELRKCKLGYLLNFNVVHMKDGIRRIVNGL